MITSLIQSRDLRRDHTTVYYDPVNDVTVVTGDAGVIGQCAQRSA